jgi:hypothetical protein
MGLLDLPAPLFGWVDAQLGGVLPPAIRLLLWGAVAGVVSMLLYRVLSPQAAIAHGKRELLGARRALDGHRGSFDEAQPLLRRLLRLALRQVGRTGWPALLASLPVLCLLAWLSSAYGHTFPAPGSAPRLETVPAALTAEWVQASPPRIALDAGGERADVALAAPVTLLHKRRWWNVLIGNPAGYLPAATAADLIRIELPRREYVALGPSWLRGWAPLFFTALLATSIALKVGARIE